MKNNKLNLLLSAMLLIIAGLYSCSNDDFTEKDAIELNRSYDQADELAEYTIIVVDASMNTTLKSMNSSTAMNGVTVTITQDGKSVSDSTDENGMVVFTNLKQGTVGANIKAVGYAEVNLIADLATGSTPGGVKASNIIPMIPITAGTSIISGTVTYESNLTNQVKEAAANVNVIATVDIESAALSGIKVGVIEQITYSDLSLSATTDANGYYEMTVPSTADGLTYNVVVSDFSANQTIFMNSFNGETAQTASEVTRSVLTVFGNNSNLSTVPSDIPPAFISIAAPTNAKIGTLAQATAIMRNPQGIASVNLTNTGNGYTNGTYYLSIPNTNSVNEATVEVYVAKNTVNYVDITNEGDSYTDGNITFNHQFVAFRATPVVNGGGEIVGLNISSYGQFLIDKYNLMSVKIQSSGGSGADLRVNSLTWSGSYYYVPTLNISDGGSGYSSTDDITILVTGLTNSAVGRINLTSSSVVAIAVNNPGSGYTPGKVLVELIGGGGQGATIDEVSVTDGKIDFITIDDGGFGYTSAPTVVFYDMNQPKAATLLLEATDFDDNGSFSDTYYFVTDGGGGYTQPPVITISAVASGTGAQAVADIDASGKVVGINIINPGAGYKAKNFVNEGVEVDPVDVEVVGAGSSILNIYLGQGKRSVEL